MEGSRALYARCRHTGYLLNVRESICALYGEDDIREDNCESVSLRLRRQLCLVFTAEFCVTSPILSMPRSTL